MSVQVEYLVQRANFGPGWLVVFRSPTVLRTASGPWETEDEAQEDAVRLRGEADRVQAEFQEAAKLSLR